MKHRCGVPFPRRLPSFPPARLPRVLGVVSLLAMAMAGCMSNDEDVPPMEYMCETDPTPSQAAALNGTCAADDERLRDLEPKFPSEVCQTLVATKTGPSEEDGLDTLASRAR